MAKLHVKKGDKVLVLSGKDKGKKGKVLSALPAEGKVVVEGVNIVKKHTRPQQQTQGGILEQEAAIQSAKVMVVCPSCQQASRVKKTVLKDGSRARACRKCGETLDK
ncbi:MAG: 50S ribosomal protein L24 [Bacillota bacterium]|nr:50S ribosomal protein L24 [Bacillota bacterium]MDW7685146.1 50S ribosomal protein L24 [Bacillota bacterium]